MPQQVINLGAAGSGAGGDSARTAFEKAIANFAELYIAALPGTAPQKQAARDMFGLGTAATRGVQSSVKDESGQAVMSVGGFSVGGTAITLDPATENLTDKPTGGWYSIPGAGSPFPVAGPIWNLKGTRSFALTARAKRAWLYTYGESPWLMELFHNQNILGTVSQAGGVPTGAIIERGSNANGEYIKWADGTLECWLRSVTVDCVADTDLDVTWPLPAAFNAVNAAVTCTLRSPAVTNNFIVHKLQGNHTSAAACTMRVRFSVTQSYLLTFHAIGRWY